MRDGLGPAILAADDPASVEAAQLALRAGGIVGVPTETVYGLGVLPRPEALEALIAAKRRPDDKGIAVLIDGLDQVAGIVHIAPSARALAARFWPGALTLVLPLLRPGTLPDALTGGHGTLGVRIPDHAVPRSLARSLGPLAVTSANISGEPAARTAAELIDAVGGSLALVLDDGPVRGGVASTVVAIDASGSLEVLRTGALDDDTIRAALPDDGGPETDPEARVH